MNDDLERQLALERLEFDAQQASIEQLISRAEAELERQRVVWQEHFDHMAMQLAEARNAALEEAAERCDSILYVNSSPSIMLGCVQCRDAIRALKAVP